MAQLPSPVLLLGRREKRDDYRRVRGAAPGSADHLRPVAGTGKGLGTQAVQACRAEARSHRLSNAKDILKFGENELNLVSHQLFMNGEEVELTKKEFALLSYFLNRQGRALTRNRIMKKVWGTYVIVTSRSIDRCVTTLRSKIEPDPRNPTYIHTIRDIGYRFDSVKGTSNSCL